MFIFVYHEFDETSGESDESLVKTHHINFVWFAILLSTVGNINIIHVMFANCQIQSFLILV